MKLIKIIGNLFLVKSKVPPMVIITPILITFIAILLKFFLVNEPIINQISLENLIWPFIAYSIFIIFKKRNSLKGIIRYFKFNFRTTLYIVIEIILSIGWWLVFIESAFKYLIVILWFFSGLLRTFIQKTPALFEYDITKLLHVNEIYGYTRASTFFLVILFCLSITQNFLTIYINLIIFWPFIYAYYYLITNLYPYIKKHIDIRRSIEILREIGNYNLSKNALLNRVHLNEKNLDIFLGRLIIGNYVQKTGRKYKLREEYIRIKNMEL